MCKVKDNKNDQGQSLSEEEQLASLQHFPSEEAANTYIISYPIRDPEIISYCPDDETDPTTDDHSDPFDDLDSELQAAIVDIDGNPLRPRADNARVLQPEVGVMHLPTAINLSKTFDLYNRLKANSKAILELEGCTFPLEQIEVVEREVLRASIEGAGEDGSFLQRWLFPKLITPNQ